MSLASPPGGLGGGWFLLFDQCRQQLFDVCKVLTNGCQVPVGVGVQHGEQVQEMAELLPSREQHRLPSGQPDEQDDELSFVQTLFHHLGALNCCTEPFPCLPFGIANGQSSSASPLLLHHVHIAVSALRPDVAVFAVLSRQAENGVQCFAGTRQVLFSDSVHWSGGGV